MTGDLSRIYERLPPDTIEASRSFGHALAEALIKSMTDAWAASHPQTTHPVIVLDAAREYLQDYVERSLKDPSARTTRKPSGPNT
jgi:hypothetical protein